MDQEVLKYIEAIPPEHRHLFDRVHRMILEACPEVEVVLSYKMPTYQMGDRRLHLAAWNHGVSIYGWKPQGDGGFTLRHPECWTSTGTIRLRTDHEATIADEEIRELARATLTPPT
ncbi:MAG: DUF1801 domain-containing protein [Acidimicrobiales bacterium]